MQPSRHWRKSSSRNHHALFLGRGPLQAIAMEGALKLKEISYIHAKATRPRNSSMDPGIGSMRHARGRRCAEQRLVGKSSNPISTKCAARGGKVVCIRGSQGWNAKRRRHHRHRHAGARGRRCRPRWCSPSPCSCWLITSPCSKAPTWIRPRNLAKSLTVE